MHDANRLLTIAEAGENAERKFANGSAELARLAGEIAAWNDSRAALVNGAVSEDRMRMELSIQVPALPPLKEWADTFGNALHQIRAALDSLAWDLVHLDGGIPPEEKRVYFPIETSGAGWRSAKRDLVSMPDVFLSRLRDLQPIGGEGLSDLVGLNQLDILDKHRGGIKLSAVTNRIHISLQVRMRAGTTVSMSMRKPRPLRSGEVVGHLLFGKGVLPGKDSAVQGGANAAVLANVGPGVEVDVETICEVMPRAMRIYFDFIYSGKLDSEALANMPRSRKPESVTVEVREFDT